jgi:hypothetical protein
MKVKEFLEKVKLTAVDVIKKEGYLVLANICLGCLLGLICFMLCGCCTKIDKNIVFVEDEFNAGIFGDIEANGSDSDEGRVDLK